MYIYAGSVGVPKQLGKKASKGSITGEGEGVYVLEWDGKDTLQKIGAACSENAGIICLSKDGQFVYAANESKDFTGLNGSGGGVSAFRVTEGGKTLLPLNTSISYGSRPSHVAVTEDNRYLLVSNHGSHSTVTCRYTKEENGTWVLDRGFDDSSLALFHLEEDGRIGPLADLHVFTGSGYWCHGGGQSTSHLHCVKVQNDYVIACNRGADCIEVLQIDREQGKLVLLNRQETRPALAPRHAVFHPTKNLLYVVNENYPCLSVYRYDTEKGEMEELQCIGTAEDTYYQEHPLPAYTARHAEVDEVNTSGMADFSRLMPSDIHITQSGDYVYVSNRCMKGKASIASFCVKEDGTLEKIQVKELQGGDPRGFQIVQDTHVLVSLMDQNILQMFVLQEGKLEKLAAQAEVKSVASFVYHSTAI